MRNGAMSTELSLRYGDGRIRVQVLCAPVCLIRIQVLCAPVCLTSET